MASKKGLDKLKPDANSIDVAWADQEMINNFARDNLQAQEIKLELKQKQKEASDLEFAEEELMMLDDEAIVPYRIGSTFINKPADQVLQMVQAKKEDVENNQKTLRQRLNTLNDHMNTLRVALYAKFGKSINLEADNDDDDDQD